MRPAHRREGTHAEAPAGPGGASRSAGEWRGDGARSEADEMLDDILAPSATHYEVLGVERSATTSEIRAAYKKRALRLHPDKYRGDRSSDAETAFKRIATAVEVLGDESSRRSYDISCETTTGEASGAPAFMGPDANGQFFSMYVFLSQVKRDLEEDPAADISESFPLILLGMAHVFVEFVAFLASESPALLATLGLIGALTGLIASEERVRKWVESLHWENLPQPARLLLIDVLCAFYHRHMMTEEAQRRGASSAPAARA